MRLTRTPRVGGRPLMAVDTASKIAALGETRFPGSNERVSDRHGEINAGSRAELATRFAEIATLLDNGTVAQEVAAATSADSKQLRRETLLAAWADPNGDQFKELGAQLAAEIRARMDRGGFMRRYLDRADVSQGGIPRIRLREPQVNAISALDIAQIGIQIIRSKYFHPNEFNVVANPRVTEIDLMQGSADMLEEVRMDGMEAIMVTEDRLLLKQLHAGASIFNDTVYFTGQLTPTVVATVQEQVNRWRLPALNMMISTDLLKDISTGDKFNEFFDPVSRLEIVMTGMIGNILGLAISTDGFRDPRLRVLDDGELLVTTAPSNIGAFSDRGPIQAEPRVNDKDFPSKGWFMWETISTTVVNAKGIARAKRI